MAEKRVSVAKNYLYNLSYQLLLLVVPLITMPYISRVFGAEKNGTYDFIQSVVSYFVLFGTIGLNIYGQREIAFYKDDPTMRSRRFFELFFLRLITVSVSLALFYILIVSRVQQPTLYALYSIELFAAIFDISWFFQGMEDFRIQAIRNFAVKLTGLGLIFLFVKTEDDLGIYILCTTLTILGGNLSLWTRVGRFLTKIRFRDLDLLRHLRPAMVLFLPQIAISIYTQLDKTMLGLLSDDFQVGYYGKAEKIVKTALTVVTSLGLVMLSRVASLYSKNEKDRMREYVINSFRFCCLLSFPILFGLCAIAPRMVGWFLGDGYEPVAGLMIVLSPIIFFIGASGVFGTQYLLPTKQMKAYTVSLLIGTGSNLLLNALLIPYFGAYGAAIATVAAEFSVLVVQLILVRSVFRISILRCAVKPFFASVIMGGCVWGLGEWLQRRMIGTFLQILCGVIIYLLLMLLFRDPFLLQIIQKGKSILHSRKTEKG